jgi:hypothetical protein
MRSTASDGASSARAPDLVAALGHADLDFAQFQVPVVVLHGVLAAATLVLVLLTEVSG